MFNEQRHRIARGIGDFATEFMAQAVENDYGFAAFDPEHMQRMMRLAFLQSEDFTRAQFGRQIKTGRSQFNGTDF